MNLPLELHPELLEKPSYATMSAAYFWKSRKLNELADKGMGSEESFIKISGCINGGLIGLESRMEYYKKAIGKIAAFYGNR